MPDGLIINIVDSQGNPMPIEDWNKYLDNINVPTDSVPSHSGSSHSEQEDFFLVYLLKRISLPKNRSV